MGKIGILKKACMNYRDCKIRVNVICEIDKCFILIDTRGKEAIGEL